MLLSGNLSAYRLQTWINLEKWTLLALLILLGISCTRGNQSSTVAEDEVLTRGLSGEPASLDPGSATDNFSSQIVQDLYEGLTNESATGEVLPGVASEWQVDSSGTKYSFRIRSNARWSNGQRIHAQQFINAWQRVVDPKTASPLANDLRIITGATSIISGHSPPSSLGATALRDDEIVVNIEQPTAYFLQLLAHSAAFPIFAEASARSHARDNWVSNGPYVLSGWQPGSSIALAKNPEYWNASRVGIKKVVYAITSDANVQLAAYRAGQIDMTDTIPSNAFKSLQSDRPAEIVIAPYLATAYYALNLTKLPLSVGQEIRKALAMAIDRRMLVQSLALGQTPAYGFVPPGTWDYEEQNVDWKSVSNNERIAEAKKLYRDAGYSARNPLNLRLLFNSNPSIKQTALLVTAMWRENLGVQTELIDEEFRVFLESRRDKSKWEAMRLAWNADYNDASNFLDIFRSDSANNDSGYKNKTYDDLLEKASHTTNGNERRGTLEQAERMMLADYPIIPLYFFVSKRMVKPYVIGVQPNPLDRVATKNLTLSAR